MLPQRATIRFGLFAWPPPAATSPIPATILVDTKLPPLHLPIPNDFNHLHFGPGQTEAAVNLPPGRHTLQLLLGDENHVPHNPPVMSRPIRVYVSRRGG